MLIRLHEIPSEGQSWYLSRKSGELNDTLRDLIGAYDYTAEIHLMPLQNSTYQLTGFIKTELPESCSRCGLDFPFLVNQKVNELLIPHFETPRDGHFAKANHYSDQTHEGPSIAEYSGNVFDLGEYLHEIIALAEPAVPAPEEDAQGNCSLCQIPVRGRSFSYDETLPAKESPFAVLKKMKM